MASTVIFFGVAAILVVNSPGVAERSRHVLQRTRLPRELAEDPASSSGRTSSSSWSPRRSCSSWRWCWPSCGACPARSSRRCGSLAIGYTDLFRGIPTILVISLLGFGMPALQLQGLPTSEVFWAIVALVLVYSAYVAEVYRAGIESVHPSQTAAARSLGLSRMQSMRHVVLPQAVRRVIPPLLNDFIGLQKDSALVAFLGVIEGLQTANIIPQSSFNFTPFVSLALVYLVITIPQTRFVDWLIERDRRAAPGRAVAVRPRRHARDRDRGAAQVLRRPAGAARRRPRGGRPRGRLPDRRVGVGQVDLAAVREPDRADRRRAHRRARATRSPRPTST